MYDCERACACLRNLFRGISACVRVRVRERVREVKTCRFDVLYMSLWCLSCSACIDIFFCVFVWERGVNVNKRGSEWDSTTRRLNPRSMQRECDDDLDGV